VTVLDKIKAFFKRPKPEAKASEKKVVEPAETKAAEAPEKKPGESSWQGISSNGVRYFD
jgi:hypothetical protein